MRERERPVVQPASRPEASHRVSVIEELCKFGQHSLLVPEGGYECERERLIERARENKREGDSTRTRETESERTAQRYREITREN